MHRRNPDFFSAGGKVHPIRGSKGYSEAVRSRIDRQKKKGEVATAKAKRERGIRLVPAENWGEKLPHAEDIYQGERRIGRVHWSRARKRWTSAWKAPEGVTEDQLQSIVNDYDRTHAPPPGQSRD